MKRIAIAALFLSLAMTSPSAASAAGASAENSAPSASSLALTRRYLAAMHVNESLRPMMSNMLSAMIEQQIQSRSGLTAEQKIVARKAITEAFEETLDASMLDRMFEAMTPSIARVFSEAELKAMVDFYESPVGQSIVAKMPEYGRASTSAILEIMPALQADLEKRIRKNIEAVIPPGS